MEGNAYVTPSISYKIDYDLRFDHICLSGFFDAVIAYVGYDCALHIGHLLYLTLK